MEDVAHYWDFFNVIPPLPELGRRVLRPMAIMLTKCCKDLISHCCRCNTEVVDKCESYTVPASTVDSEQRSESITFNDIQTCDIETVADQHCADLPMAEICTPRTVTCR